MKRYIVCFLLYSNQEKVNIYISANSSNEAYNKAYYFLNKSYGCPLYLVSVKEEQ